MAGSIKPTRGTRRRGAALLAVAAVLLSAPVAWAFGELSQKPATAGCVSETGSGGVCLNGKALGTPFGVATSPGGRNLYVASAGSDAVDVVDRDPATGALTQQAGTAACVSEDGTGGLCQTGAALDAAAAVAASPDGKSVYVTSASSDAVAVFDRDSASGALMQKPGTAGCVSEDGSGGLCQNGTGLDGAFRVVTAPDGEGVYVASRSSDAVAVFDRDPVTGALTQKPGTAGCVSEDGSRGACQNGTALEGAFDVAASADGKSVYIASSGSDAVAVFDRDPATGVLTQNAGLACVSETGTGACQDGIALDGAVGVVASPDGKSVYVASGLSDAVAVFDRATPSSPAPPLLPPPPPDALAPTVAGVAFTPSRFRVAPAATPTDARAARRRAPRGSRLRFTLSEPAAARILIDRARPGRTVGRRCKAPIRRLRKHRRCTGYRRGGILTRHTLPAGPDTIRFSGRIGKRALAPGRYRATVTATDPVGNRSTPTRATFTIVRR